MKIYGKRALLNEPGFHGTAAIVAELHNREGWWNAQVSLSDCSRVVNISFHDPSSCSDDQFYNDMGKLYAMQDALKEFEKGMRKVRRASKR